MRTHRAVVVVAMALGAAVAATGCTRHLPPAPREADGLTVGILRSELNVERSAGGPAVELPEPTGWATLRGTFKINGQEPPRPPLSVSGNDTAICAPGGRTPLSEAVVIGPDSGIRDIVIYLTTKTPPDDPQWEHPDYAATKTATVDFDQKQCIFLSHVFAMRSTQKLRILNSDPVGHNTKLEPKDGCAPFNQTIPAGGFVIHEVRGQEKAPFPVSCSIHPWMRGAMITRDNPYFAVTKADGSFEIKNLPAGVPLEFQIWQEKVGFVQSVTINGNSQSLRRGKYTLPTALTPGEEQTLEVFIDADAFN